MRPITCFRMVRTSLPDGVLPVRRIIATGFECTGGRSHRAPQRLLFLPVTGPFHCVTYRNVLTFSCVLGGRIIMFIRARPPVSQTSSPSISDRLLSVAAAVLEGLGVLLAFGMVFLIVLALWA